MMIAQVCDMEPGEFIHSFGDVHFYKNHFEQAEFQLTRTPFPFPQMKINPAVKNIFDFKFEDFELINYQSHPAIKAPVAVCLNKSSFNLQIIRKITRIEVINQL